MATLTVGTGGDYSTIAAAIAAAGASDVVQLIEDVAENVALNKNIAGIESDSPTSRKTWSNSGSSDVLLVESGLNQACLIKDLIVTSNSSSSGLIYFPTTGGSMQLTFRNVKFTHTGTATGTYMWNQNGNHAGMLTYDRCEIVGNATAYAGVGSAVATATDVYLIKNCIFYGFSRVSSAAALYLQQPSSNNVLNEYCNTYYGNHTGVALGCTATHTDCVYVGNTDDISYWNNAVATDWTYCGFEEQGTGGTGCVFGLDGGVEFVNEGAYDFHLNSGADCRDAGTTVGSVTEDFDQVSRPQGSDYCIGAYEYVEASGPPAGSLMMVGVGI